MSELLGVTVDDLVATMKARQVRIPSEIGAFVALEACEALMNGPARVSGADVRIADDGTISVFVPPASATSEDAARSVVQLLATLLVAAGTGIPRALVGLLDRGPSSGRWELASLRDDLEASLIPLNRAAARRVLGRMLRETRRPRSGRPPPPDRPAPSVPPALARSNESLDGELDDLLDVPASAPAPELDDPFAPTAAGPSAPPPQGGLDAELDATLSELDSLTAPAEHQEPPHDDRTINDDLGPALAPTVNARMPLEPARSNARSKPQENLHIAQPVSEPPRGRAPREVEDLDSLALDAGKSKGGFGLGWILAFVALLAVTAAALAILRPDLIDGLLGRPSTPDQPQGPTEADRQRMLAEHRARFGELTVRVDPAEAQVLLFLNHSPAVATDMPIGLANEFIAIPEGRRPARAVLPADAHWETVEGHPRFELAIQGSSEAMEESALVLGPTQLPREMGAATGQLGEVRIITNPPEAKVYVLIGFSPIVTLENAHTDQAVELLVWAEGHRAQTVVVTPSDWQPNADGSKHAEVEVTLEPLTPPRRR